MAVGTTTTTPTALKQYWHDFFLENLYDLLAMKGLTKQAKVPTGSGTTVWWVGIGKVNPVGAALTEGILWVKCALKKSFLNNWEV